MFSPVLLAALLQAAQPVPASSMVVRGVSVINPVTGLVAANRTILIRGNRIVAVGGKTLHAPSGAVEVDGAGKFAIPGLWDMHTHALFGAEELSLPLLVANGVSGYLEMLGSLAHIMEDRE
jgi:imidazolonepropionase-like amidohydrolase